jgi:diguanylate cyclase (GGDEF)-like protein
VLGSLRWRIVVGTAACALVLIGAVAFAVDRLRAAETERLFAQFARTVATLISDRVEPALSTGDQASWQRTARRAVERGTALAVVVLDRDHRVVAAEPAGIAQTPPLGAWPEDASERLEVAVRGVRASAVFQVVHGREDDLGGVWVAVDMRPLAGAAGRFRSNLAVLALVALTVCVGAGLIAAHLVVTPLAGLAATLAAVARGEEHARHPVGGAEDIRVLARNVNQVAEQLEAAYAEQKRLAASLDTQVTERTRQFEQNNRLLRQLGQQDVLTQLPNRLGLQKEMERYLSLCRRSGQPLAVIMLDLDGFKAYNDTLGHAAGDKLLCTVAAALKGRSRASDIVARLGGDEFCILIPFTTAERAVIATEGFIGAVTDATRDLPRPDTGTVLGASAGVACFPEDGEEGLELIARADAALYRAKAAGKGRVFRASSPQPEPTT